MNGGGVTLAGYGVWGSSSTNVYAVGHSGRIFHYDGTSWSRMVSGTSETLNGVWGNSGTDVYAVGSAGAFCIMTGQPGAH